jgi:hypothetical protein
VKQIILKLSDGRLAYSRPCAKPLEGETEEAYLERVASETIEKCARDGIPGFAGAVHVASVPPEIIPSDPVSWKYRDAWDWTTPEPKIDIDIEKARGICLKHLRLKRDTELSRLDQEQNRHRRDPAKVEEIENRKVALRDMPNTVADAITAAQTLDALEAVALP